MTKKISKKTKPAKRNQTDLTLRNLRALKKTVALLAADVAALDANLILTSERLGQIEWHVGWPVKHSTTKRAKR